MKSEKGYTLLELMATIMIIGIAMAITLPTFTNSNKNISEKIIYSQFESVFQKTSSDAIAIGDEVKLVLGEEGYIFESQKTNKEVKYPSQVTIKAEDVGKEIVFNSEGKVKNPLQITFYYIDRSYNFEVAQGFQNIKINGIYLNEFKKIR